MKSLLKYALIYGSLCCITWCSFGPTKLIEDIPNQDNQKEIPAQTTIHALWDSLTAWYQLPLEDSYPSQLEAALKQKWYDIKVLNAWISWDTSEWLLKRLDRQLESAKKDDIAILVIGANDWLRGMPLDQMTTNIASISKQILEKELFLVIWWMQIPLNNSPEYREEFQQVYTDMCSTYKANTRVSCLEFFLADVWGIPELNLQDGIHPTKEWYSIVVQNVLPYVESLLLK